MQIATLLSPNAVVADLPARNKSQVLLDLVKRAAAPDIPAALQALQQREALGSTGLGRGFALPHTRLDGLTRFHAAFARLRRPVDYAAIDGQPVDLVFLLLIPTSSANDHLAALAAISRRLRVPGILQQLRQAKSANELFELLGK